MNDSNQWPRVSNNEGILRCGYPYDLRDSVWILESKDGWNRRIRCPESRCIWLFNSVFDLSFNGNSLERDQTCRNPESRLNSFCRTFPFPGRSMPSILLFIAYRSFGLSLLLFPLRVVSRPYPVVRLLIWNLGGFAPRAPISRVRLLASIDLVKFTRHSS